MKRLFNKYYLQVMTIFIVGMMVIFALVYALINNNFNPDFRSYSSVPQGQITVLDKNKTVFIPEGSYLVGDAYQYIANNDTFEKNVPQRTKTSNKILVETSSKVVVYWSLDQQVTAESLLNN